MIKVALSMRDLRFSYGKTKKVIKDALRKYLPKELVFRKKTGWGFPIYKWMSPGGVLYPLVKELEHSSFAKSKLGVTRNPDDFTWRLLNFNLWHRHFFGESA